jgi:hypothetical protein
MLGHVLKVADSILRGNYFSITGMTHVTGEYRTVTIMIVFVICHVAGPTTAREHCLLVISLSIHILITRWR